MSEIKTLNPTESPTRMREGSIESQSTSQQSSGGASSKCSRNQRKSSSLPSETVEYLKAWMMSPEHIAHPYPTEQEKAQIMADTGIELKQLTNWFVNNRKRYWKPRVEARLQQQAHAAAAAAQAHAAAAAVAVAAVSHQSPNQISYGNAVTHTHPVTPVSTFRSTINVQPKNSFISFDLCSPQPAPQPQSSQVVSAELPSYLSTAPSSASVVHTISEDSSSSSSIAASENDSLSSIHEDECSDDASGDEYDPATGTVTRAETVDVHIVRPLSGQRPTIEDVTILSHVPAERIVKSYEKCALTVRYPKNEPRKMQSRRDAEIVRVKKQYLKLYFEEIEQAQAQQVESPPKRKRQETEISTPRNKFRRKSLEVWRDACKSASTLFDDNLPSLDEAVQLFGY